jgi:hypothetical protein
MLSMKRSTWRLVHLAEDEGRLGDDARLGHLVDEVVALARALAHAGEDRDARVLLGDVADELLDDDRLAHAGAAEDADLAALLEGADEVDDLDARLEELVGGGLLVEGGCRAVDGQVLGGVHRALGVDGLPQHVEDAAQGGLAHGHADGRPGVGHLGAARQAVGGGHGHRAHPVVAQVLLDLAGEAAAVGARDLDGVVDGRQVTGRELDVDDRAGDLDDLAGRGRGGGGHALSASVAPRTRSRPTRSRSSRG